MSDALDTVKEKGRDLVKIVVIGTILNDAILTQTGDAGTGKSSFCTSFCFNHMQVVDPANEDMYSRTATLDDRMYVCELYEVVGTDEFQKAAWYQNADAFLIMYDVTLKETFDSTQGYREGIAHALETKEETNTNLESTGPIILYGNKVDMPPGDRETTIAEGRALARNLGKHVAYWEGTVMNRKNVEEPIHELIRFVRKKKLAMSKKEDKEMGVEEEIEKSEKCCRCVVM